MNGSNSAQTVDVALYDEGATPSCTAADIIFDPTMLAGQIINAAPPMGHKLSHGLAEKTVSASIVGNIWVDYR